MFVRQELRTWAQNFRSIFDEINVYGIYALSNRFFAKIKKAVTTNKNNMRTISSFRREVITAFF